jgi:uncharacterized protein YggE
MTKLSLAVLVISLNTGVCLAQASGNVGYGQTGGNAKARQNERNKRVLAQGEMPPANSMFIEASVLINVKADEHVATFGLTQEGLTVAECNQKLDATINEFASELRQLDITREDYFVDFAAQNKIYGYQVTGEIAKEKLVGFELKKNISIHYRDKLLLDKLVLAAARANIFDLIKVDYLVKDTSALQERLMEEATRVIKLKAARYEKLLGFKLQPLPQVYAERPSLYFPTEMYDSYIAQESEEMSSDAYRQKYTIQRARKSRTFYFNPLSADGFDVVINPVVIEPVVQFTLYLKVKYELEQSKSK